MSHFIVSVPSFPRGFFRRVANVASLIEQDWEMYTEVLARLAGGWDNPVSAQVAAWIRATTKTPSDYRSGLDALNAFSQESLAAVRAPTLILHGLDSDLSR